MIRMHVIRAIFQKTVYRHITLSKNTIHPFQAACAQSQPTASSAADKDGATSDLAHESSAESAVKIKEQGQCHDDSLKVTPLG